MERAMRGDDERTDGMFSYVRPEQRVPVDHPLRPIREIVDRALEALSARFEALYSRTGRPSIPPEKLLRALLLQAFCSVRSERQLMEQLEYNLLFRWFVGWTRRCGTRRRSRRTETGFSTAISLGSSWPPF
jgi:transposase